MKNNLTYILVAAIGVGFLGACCTKKSAMRYIESHPEVVSEYKKDTTIVVESVRVDTTLVVDTIAEVDSFYVLGDTITDTLVKIYRYRDTLKVSVPPRIDSVEVPVTRYEFVTKEVDKPWPWWSKGLMVMGALLLLAVLFGIYKGIRLIMK